MSTSNDASDRDHAPIRDAMEQWPAFKPPCEPADPVDDPGPETICTHFGEQPQRYHGAASPPIFQTSTFLYPDAEAFERRRQPGTERYDYTRGGNPTNQILEAKLARLERGRWADCFASGMGAISAALCANLAADTHVVATAHCYGPTQWLLDHLRRFGVSTTFVNSTDPQAFIDAARPETRVLYLESPTSGRFDLIEIEPLTRFARQRGIVTIFDNSWASPYFQNPLELGVDLVVHSATKYINGHSDVVAGVVVGRDPQLRQRVWREIELGGAILDPHAAWLMLRGLRTLPLRMERHQHNALKLAGWLAGHPRVACVRYPGLPSHPQHELARRQMRGYGSLFSFALREQSRAAMNRFFDRLRLFGIGVSWGGYESLILGGTLFSERPDKPEWLIRVHVGLENVDDLIADMRQALED